MNTDNKFPPLWDHQKLAILRAKSHEPLGLFFELGTGKSRTACEIIRWHWEERRRRTLIFAPIVVLENWKREFLKFTDIPKDAIYVLQGTGTQKAASVDTLKFGAFNEYIVIVNYEALISDKVLASLLRLDFDSLVCDELHKCKSHKALRTKKVIKLSKNIKYRYGLTGTPVLNSAMDLFSQYQILFGGFPEYPGPGSQIQGVLPVMHNNIVSFQREFFIDLNLGMPRQSYFPDLQIKNRATEVINRTIRRTSVHVKKSDCLTLPPFLKIRVETKLTEEQKKIYHQMLRDFIAFFDNGDVAKASLAMVKAIRLMQIVSGFVTLADDTTHVFKETNRMEALSNLLEQIGPTQKVIIWATFRQNYIDIKQVCERLKLQYSELHGEIPTHNKQEQIDRFNLDPNYNVMIANQMSGGVGVNLIAAAYSIYYSRDFSLEGDTQSEGRNYRAGSEIHEKITRYDLVTPGTVDELVLQRLEQKQALGSEILGIIRNTFGGNL